jgi:hypothetical protein
MGSAKRVILIMAARVGSFRPTMAAGGGREEGSAAVT